MSFLHSFIHSFTHPSFNFLNIRNTIFLLQKDLLLVLINPCISGFKLLFFHSLSFTFLIIQPFRHLLSLFFSFDYSIENSLKIESLPPQRCHNNLIFALGVFVYLFKYDIGSLQCPAVMFRSICTILSI